MKIDGRVVLLGGSGFIGKDLARHLGRQHAEVVSLSSKDVDLCSEHAVESLAKIVLPGDAVVVLSCVTPDKGRDVLTQMKNIEMGKNLYRFLENSSPSYVLYASSDAVYSDELPLLRENAPCEPSGFYGLTHLVRERLCRQALAAKKIPLGIARPSIIYGAGDTHASYGPNRFFKTALKDKKISLFGNGEETRDHVYIEDVSRLLAFMIEQRLGATLNIATGRAVSFKSVADHLQALWGGKLVMESLPRSGPITHRQFDNAEIFKRFPGFKFTAPEDGLRQTFEALR